MWAALASFKPEMAVRRLPSGLYEWIHNPKVNNSYEGSNSGDYKKEDQNRVKRYAFSRHRL